MQVISCAEGRKIGNKLATRVVKTAKSTKLPLRRSTISALLEHGIDCVPSLKTGIVKAVANKRTRELERAFRQQKRRGHLGWSFIGGEAEMTMKGKKVKVLAPNESQAFVNASIEMFKEQLLSQEN